MAEIPILSERELQLSIDESTGFYVSSFISYDLSKALAAGQQYRVVWEGTDYVFTAAATVVNGADFVYIGNKLFAGGEDDGVPFVIATNADASTAGWLVFSLTEGSKTVCVYQVIRDGVDVVLKDRNGDDVIYEEVKKVVLNGTDGNGVTFSAGELLEGLDIDLDMSNGYQTVEAPEGYLLKSATIKKPESLIPENIAEGINIAGIIGTLAAGGDGGGSIKMSAGTAVHASATSKMFNHNLGVIPDLFIGYIPTSGSVPTVAASNVVGIFVLLSSALKASLGISYGFMAVKTLSATKKFTISVLGSTITSMSAANVTETTLTFGSSSYDMGGADYAWIAIGGLFGD